MDIGVVIQAPMEDKAWIKKCALMGLLSFGLMLIPVVGAFLAYINGAGWMRAYADARLRGEKELPPVNMGYLGAGFQMFLMYLPLMGIMIAIYGVTFALMMIGARTHAPVLNFIALLLLAAAVTPVALWMMVMGPGILYLHVVQGEPWASMKLGRQWRTMMAGGTDYLLLWVAIFVAGLIGQLGFVACGVGMLVSLPYAGALYGAALAEFQRSAGERVPPA